MATNIVLKRSATSGAVPGTSDLALGEIALNTFDGKMYMKKTVSGTSTIVELTGNKAATSSAFAHDSYKYTADANQTTFTGSDANSQTLSYNNGQIQVYLNGILLDATDFTATNGTSVVLASGASANDILYIVSFKGTNPFDYFKYTATNAQTSFSGDDANSESLLYTVGNIAVYLNGVLLDATDFTASTGTSVVLASGATTNDILVIYAYLETGLTDVSDDTTPQLSGDLDLNGHDIISLSNADIDIIPHGTGNVNLGTDTIKVGTSGENITVTTNGTGDMTLSTNSGTNSGTIVIADGANNDITLTPNGTGDVIIDGLKYPQADGSADQVLKTDGSGQLAFTTISSNSIVDADGDTKIQVEESSDEDTIRFDIAGTEQLVLADGVLKPTTDNDIDLGTSSLEFKNAFFDGTVTTDALVVDTADINGGTVDGATIGANSASSGAFTTVSTTSHLSIGGSNNELRFYEGSNYVGFEAPALSADKIWVLPAADGSSGQFLKTDGSGNFSFATASSTVTGLTDTTISSVAGGDILRYNGSAWVNTAQASNPFLNTMTGDNSDTTLTLSQAPLHENAVQVFWDGVYQNKDTWAVSGSTLTFSTAPPTGVKVEAVTNGEVNILYGNDVAVSKMTGDNSDTTLALDVTPSNENHVSIYFDGVYQSKDNYTLSGSTITFSTAPPTGVLVEAVSNQAVSIGTATGIASSALTGLAQVTAADADHVLIYDASASALKKALVSDLVQTSEEIADIVGAMVSSNTESGITVAYQDADNTLDFTIGTLNQNTTGSAATLTTPRAINGVNFDGSAAVTVTAAAGTLSGDTLKSSVTASSLTSLGTLTALTVDNITLNGNTLTTTTSDFIVDASHAIVLDAEDGGYITLKDGGTSYGEFNKATNDFTIASKVNDGDILFKGKDGSSVITALTLDMSDGGNATFNQHAYFKDNGFIVLGAGEDLKLNSDGTNAIINAAHGYLALQTGSTERLRIGSSGSLELGYSGATRQQANSQAFSIITPASGGGQGIAFKRLDTNTDQGLGEITWSNNTQDGLGKMIGKTDGANNSLAILFQTASAGTLGDRFKIESTGDMRFGLMNAGLTAGECYTFDNGQRGNNFTIRTGGGAHLFGIDMVNLTGGTCKHIQFRSTGSATVTGSITSTGNNATQYNTSSDYRLKENVDYTWDATTRLKQLKPARFNFISDADNTVDGFLAHEVSSIVPESITGTKDASETKTNCVLMAGGSVFADGVTEAEWTDGKAAGTYESDTTWVASKTEAVYQQIDQAKLVPLLVKTIQELEARIKTLEDA